jgi:DNA transformation protein
VRGSRRGARAGGRGSRPDRLRAYPDAATPRAVDPALEALLDLLRGLDELRPRRMFGGTGIYSGDAMFALVMRGRVYVKTDPALGEELAALGSRPFMPRRGARLGKWMELPAELLEDQRRALGIARRAMEAAEASAPRLPAECPPEAILGGVSPELQRLVEELRAVVRGRVPGVDEVGRPGRRLIAYRKRRDFCFLAPMRDHVRLGFGQGVRLSDPHELLRGSGSRVRWIPLRPGQALPLGALGELVAEAATLASGSGRRRPRPRRRAGRRA